MFRINYGFSLNNSQNLLKRRFRLFNTTSRLFQKLPNTIYSLSTPWGVSGVSVIRISGPNAKEV